LKMNKNEGAKDFIARVDTAVSDLSILNEKVSTNSWLFIMAKGLREELKKCKDGVLFSEKGFATVPELKAMIMKEETILGISKPELKVSSETETANAVFDGVCNFCNKKGHKKAECFKFKKQQKEIKNPKETYWCGYCNVAGHTTDYCFWNPANNQTGKGKAKGKGKVAKGKGKGKGKGKSGKENKEDELTEIFQPITSQKKHTMQQNNGIQAKNGKALTTFKMNHQCLIGKITVLQFLRNPRPINLFQPKTDKYACFWKKKRM
jgi:hypothetical protein